MAWTAKYPSEYTSTTIKWLSAHSSSYDAILAIDPSLPLTGGAIYNSWQGARYNTSNRVNVDYGTAFIAKRLYLENHHSTGTVTDRGFKNFKVYGSNSSTGFTTTTIDDYTDLTELGSFTATEHPATNTSDPQYFSITNTTAYRYYTIIVTTNQGNSEWIGVRHLELQQGNDEVLASWQEPYNIGYTGRVTSFTESYHNISEYLTTGYTEPMAYSLLASWREPYRSTPQHLAFWREPYLAAPEYIRSFVEPYISADEVLAFWREEWTEQPAILATWSEPYRVADVALLASITEPYSLEELSQLMPYWREQYAMTIGTSLYQRVERVH